MMMVIHRHDNHSSSWLSWSLWIYHDHHCQQSIIIILIACTAVHLPLSNICDLENWNMWRWWWWCQAELVVMFARRWLCLRNQTISTMTKPMMIKVGWVDKRESNSFWLNFASLVSLVLAVLVLVILVLATSCLPVLLVVTSTSSTGTSNTSTHQ